MMAKRNEIAREGPIRWIFLLNSFQSKWLNIVMRIIMILCRFFVDVQSGRDTTFKILPESSPKCFENLKIVCNSNDQFLTDFFRFDEFISLVTLTMTIWWTVSAHFCEDPDLEGFTSLISKLLLFRFDEFYILKNSRLFRQIEWFCSLVILVPWFVKVAWVLGKLLRFEAAK